MAETFWTLYGALFGMGEVLAPEYVLPCILIAWLVWLRREPGEGFWRWLAPREIWTHRSHRLDLSLWLLGRAMALSGVFARLSVAPVVAVWVAGFVRAGDDPGLSPWIAAALAFVALDFARYWLHRLLHGSRRLWPVHALHHSAEVMTPITTYRQHPLWVAVVTVVLTAFLGVVLGLTIGTLSPETGLAQIAGINAFFVLANAGLATLHHSHVWIGFGPVLERLVISPAQHQIHHSNRPEHFDRNFGETLAVWDWMFGTLYVTRGEESVRFGLTGVEGAHHAGQTLGKALVVPLRRMIARRP